MLLSRDSDGRTRSRRMALRHMLLGGAALAAVRVSGASAQATPATGGLPPVIQQWLAAYGAHDAAAMAALYTPDAIYEDVPNHFMAKGPEIATFLSTAEQGFADVRLDVRHGFGTDAGAFVEYDYHATNNGMIPGPSVGTSFVSRAVTVFELDGGKIRRSADYYDLTAIMTQLGVMPPQGPAATPAS